MFYNAAMTISRTLLAVVMILQLTACGFTPLYGARGPAETAETKAGLSRTYIESIPEREGQYLRNALMDRLYLDGRPEHPLYTLTVLRIQEIRTDLDIT
ncbi:MAG: hypothetical protein H5T99_05675, partial [Moorella sp. (in: Bacteria)]|nr:hypothetical protein [Moorella sp. (in: firmicutes)]